MLNWTKFSVFMSLTDFQNKLYNIVVQTANSTLELKKYVSILRWILGLKKLDASVNQPQ